MENSREECQSGRVGVVFYLGQVSSTRRREVYFVNLCKISRFVYDHRNNAAVSNRTSARSNNNLDENFIDDA